MDIAESTTEQTTREHTTTEQNTTEQTTTEQNTTEQTTTEQNTTEHTTTEQNTTEHTTTEQNTTEHTTTEHITSEQTNTERTTAEQSTEEDLVERPAPTSVTNSLGVIIKEGSKVVIGKDIGDYDIAHVNRIVARDTDDDNEDYIQITYLQTDHERALVPIKRFRKPWTDICQVNTVILALGNIEFLPIHMDTVITDKTKEIYDY